MDIWKYRGVGKADADQNCAEVKPVQPLPMQRADNRQLPQGGDITTISFNLPASPCACQNMQSQQRPPSMSARSDRAERAPINAKGFRYEICWHYKTLVMEIEPRGQRT